MLNISFEINGRNVDPQRAGDALTQVVLGQVIEHIKKQVGSVRCQEHGSSPKITCKGRSIDNLSFEVSGCCEGLIKKVEAKLK